MRAHVKHLGLFSSVGYSKKRANGMPWARQLADKGVSTVKLTKSFRPPFSKGGAVEGA
jgi:hypothetical protein